MVRKLLLELVEDTHCVRLRKGVKIRKFVTCDRECDCSYKLPLLVNLMISCRNNCFVEIMPQAKFSSCSLDGC